MLTVDKVTELFFMADEFCKVFDKMMAKYTLRKTGKRYSLKTALYNKGGYHTKPTFIKIL